ncbi:hypothetical protein H9L06_07865 [Leucobacter denitrificans]|uniref:DUF559 domain-containing protein n=1 Tax=Leucobacter denitrificans TaxID=683042 RepID=A0A7G9S800_9MICO|nr:hypothetical protein H9L06_07865 [Leucobacter denitrificans]
MGRSTHGVVTAPGVDPQAFETRVASIALCLRPGQFFTRRTAAKLLGLPNGRLARNAGNHVDVGAVRPIRPPTRQGVSGMQIGDGVLSSLPEAPYWVPSPEDVWALLAPVADLEELVIVGDFLISGKDRWAAPMSSLDNLRDSVRRFSGCTGVGRLREALPLLRTGVESPTETHTRLLIRAAGLPEPITCCPVPIESQLLHADLGYPEWKIAIDYEGQYHFEGGAEQARRDNERHEAMRAAGWRVLLVTALDLRDPRRFLGRLAAAIVAAQ